MHENVQAEVKLASFERRIGLRMKRVAIEENKEREESDAAMGTH